MNYHKAMQYTSIKFYTVADSILRPCGFQELHCNPLATGSQHSYKLSITWAAQPPVSYASHKTNVPFNKCILSTFLHQTTFFNLNCFVIHITWCDVISGDI